jgi:hypothetical protein
MYIFMGEVHFCPFNSDTRKFLPLNNESHSCLVIELVSMVVLLTWMTSGNRPTHRTFFSLMAVESPTHLDPSALPLCSVAHIGKRIFCGCGIRRRGRGGT